jgi:hypothetical protein
MAAMLDFTFLLMYLYSPHGLLSLGHLGSTNTPSSSCSRMIQLSRDRPLSTTACWHTNNLSITTIIRQHALKNHVRKKPIFMAFIAKQKLSLCCGIAFFFSIGSSGLSQVPFSSIFYHSNIEISIPATTTTKTGATKTKELCQQGHQMPPYSMLDYGSRWLAYAGDNDGGGMIEDTVKVNRFPAEHSCLDNNINTNKNQGLFLWMTMMMVQPIAME